MRKVLSGAGWLLLIGGPLFALFRLPAVLNGLHGASVSLNIDAYVISLAPLILSAAQSLSIGGGLLLLLGITPRPQNKTASEA